MVYVDFDGPVACQVGFRREKGVAVYGPADQVFFTAKDPALLEVSVKEQTSYGVRLYLKPLKRGTPIVQARLGSATGPILAEQEVDEFTVDSSAATHVVVNGDTDTANTFMVMKPWIPNIDVNCAMFASYSTFAGGATAYALNTSDFGAVNVNGDPAVVLSVDPSTGETQVVLRVDFEIPSDEDSYCFQAQFDQHSKYGTVIGDVKCNGNPCRFGIKELTIAEGNLAGRTLMTTAWVANRNVPYHPAGHAHTMSPVENTGIGVRPLIYVLTWRRRASSVWRMPRKPRIQYPGAVYHVMSRGDRGGRIFKEPLDYEMFLGGMGEVCERAGWRIHAYALLPNHFYLGGARGRPAWLSVDRVLGNLALKDTRRDRQCYEWYLSGCMNELRTKAGRKEYQARWRPVRHHWYVGTEEFGERLLKELQKSVEGKKRSSYSGPAIHAHDESEAERLVGKGIESLGLAGQSLAELPRGDVRKCALAWLVRSRTTVSNVWIIARLAMGVPSNMSAYIGRVQLAKDRAATRVRRRIEKDLRK